MKILIAEDDAVASEVQQLNLEHIGQEVVITRTGTEAWETFDRADRIGIQRWYLPPSALKLKWRSENGRTDLCNAAKFRQFSRIKNQRVSNGGSLYGPVAAVTDD